MAKLRIFVSFTAILISTLLFVNCTEDDSPTTPSIDYIAPYVEWVNLSNSEELSGTVEFSFSVYDENGIDSVKLYINGALFLGSADIPVGENTDTTITIEWNTLDYEDGVYILEVRAWDDSGNLGISPSLMVNVKNDIDPPPEDRLAPYVHWIAPEAGSTLKDTVSLQVGLYDENSIDSVKLYINGAAMATIHFPYVSRGV